MNTITATAVPTREERIARWRAAVASSPDRSTTLNERVEACMSNAVDALAEGEPEESIAWASMAHTLTVRPY